MPGINPYLPREDSTWAKALRTRRGTTTSKNSRGSGFKNMIHFRRPWLKKKSLGRLRNKVDILATKGESPETRARRAGHRMEAEWKGKI